jgi:hypothetical protein
MTEITYELTFPEEEPLRLLSAYSSVQAHSLSLIDANCAYYALLIAAFYLKKKQIGNYQKWLQFHQEHLGDN